MTFFYIFVVWDDHQGQRELKPAIRLHFCLQVCFKNLWRIIYALQASWDQVWMYSARKESTRVSSFSLCTSWWSDKSRTGSGCVAVDSLPPFWESFDAPEAWVLCLPQHHLNSPRHVSQNGAYVSQTGSNWSLPWFPHWKEQLQEGGAYKGGGRVTWPRREMPDVMWPVVER